MKETDLYPPLKEFLVAQGYDVKGEVKDCDVVAVRDDEVVIVELKLRLNLDLILQAVERLKLSESVYIGIPEDCPSYKKRRKAAVKTLRMLGLGLLRIDPNRTTAPVDVVLDPAPYKPRANAKGRKRLLGEFQRLVGDPNLGGSSTKRGRMTAYRQRALAIAHYLTENGPSKAADVANALGDKDARTIMYRNVYGWFDRPATGIYALSPRGETERIEWSK